MAESVDALVSNTSGATRAGSTPALGTTKAENQMIFSLRFYLFIFTASTRSGIHTLILPMPRWFQA